MNPATSRTLDVIAQDVLACWPRPYFGAVPYLRAMLSMRFPTDSYGVESAPSIVRYFLANASAWRGPDARRIKAELKQWVLL